MLFADVAGTLDRVRATRSRKAKTEAVAACLREATADEVSVVASYLGGSLTQRRTGVGWRSLASLPEPAGSPSLQVSEVDAAFSHLAGLAGAGSQLARREALATLFGRATAGEQELLRGLVSGEVRTGALEGVLVEALAAAFSAPAKAVRRAAMLSGSPSYVARVLVSEGEAGLAEIGLAVGHGVKPMLAASAPDIDAAVEVTGLPALADGKLDGIRIQVHRDGDDVRVYSRSLDDLTGRFPRVEEVVASLDCERVVLDGEAMLVDEAGRPRMFQDTASASATRTAGETVMQPWFFDVLHLDGSDLLDRPLRERVEVLDRLVPREFSVPRAVVSSLEGARAFNADVLGRGHEGVVLKALEGPWEAGRRGSGWVKVKPVHTLDLVVLAVERGSGRRQGWLSNIHLGARDGDGFVMLGKTFKGMTDEMLQWQTERFTDLADGPTDGYVVSLRPVQVVEIAFDGVQRSTRYPGGVALRFARVLRYREDKTADEADTLASVRALL